MLQKLMGQSLPWVTLTGGAILTALLWFIQAERENQALRQLLGEEVDTIIALAEREVSGIENAVKRQAGRWYVLNGTPRDVWDVDAINNLDSYIGLTTLAWIDKDGVVRWSIEKDKSNEVEFEPTDTPALADVLVQEDEIDDPAVSAVFASRRDGAVIFFIVESLYVTQNFDGYIVARVALEPLFTGILQQSGPQIALSLTVAGNNPIEIASAGVAAAGDLVSTKSLTIGGTSIQIVGRPTQAFLKNYEPDLISSTLILGLVGTAICTAFAAMVMQIRRQNIALTNARDQVVSQDRRYRDLFASGNLGFLVCDRHGRVIDCNDGCAHILGYAEADDIVGRNAAEFVSNDERERLATRLSEMDSTEITHNRQWCYRRPDGSEVIGLVNSVREGEGEDARLLCIINDITQHALMERAAAEANSVYQNLFSNSGVAIFDDDLSGLFPYLDELRKQGVTDLRAYAADNPTVVMECAQRAKLNNVNPAGMKMFGVDSLDKVDREQYFTFGNRPQIIFEMACAIWSGKTQHQSEDRYSRIDGVQIPIAYSMRLPTTIEEARRVPVLVLDLTEIKAAATAREANIAKSRFLASMSHEIRTPLNGVIANLELLAQTDLADDQIDLLDDADKAAKSLLALIGNILDFSKIEAGKLTIEMGEVNVEMLVHQTTDILQSKARQKGVFITASFGADVPAVIRGDATRLRQILLNLVGNSIKFTQQGGIHLGVNALEWDGAVCLLEFIVHDSGLGFSQADAARLFEAFSQQPGTGGRAQEEGTGLGLSICRSLVETFGGELTAEGEPGAGATFRFTIPVECLMPAPSPHPADLSGRTIALIRDHAFGTSRIAAYFKARHARTEQFETIGEALDACLQADVEGRHFDVAVIGALSSNMTRDRESLRILRQHHTVPFIVGDAASNEAWRKMLRIGSAFLISPSGDDERLDRNIKALTGASITGPKQAKAKERQQIASVDFSGFHILVLEDRLLNQTVIQRQLKRLNIACTVAGDGFQGLQRLKSRAFDLVLADCSMPNMDGFEFTREVRRLESKAHDGRRLPIIALTANAFREDAEKCFAAGMDDFLSKPITLDRLSVTLERWLGPKSEATHKAAAPEEKTFNDDLPVDINVLSDLLGTADPIVMAEVFGEFIVAARASFDEVSQYVKVNDMTGLSAAAHGAKGEARNVAAQRLGDLYAELEAKAITKDAASSLSLLNKIDAELNRVTSFMNAYARAPA